MPSESDLAARRPVWAALSELFLDAAPTEAGRGARAREVARSPYTADELETILLDEVLPVLAPNLSAPAGVWGAFDPEWLEREILRRAGRRRYGFGRRAAARIVEPEWRELRRRVERRRAGEEGDEDGAGARS